MLGALVSRILPEISGNWFKIYIWHSGVRFRLHQEWPLVYPKQFEPARYPVPVRFRCSNLSFVLKKDTFIAPGFLFLRRRNFGDCVVRELRVVLHRPGATYTTDMDSTDHFHEKSLRLPVELPPGRLTCVFQGLSLKRLLQNWSIPRSFETVRRER